MKWSDLKFWKKDWPGICAFLKEETSKGKTILPPPEDRHNAFTYTPLEKVKVVILGQDPFHRKGQAMGLAFAVPWGVDAPPSLKNIFKELYDDLGENHLNFSLTE